MILKCDAGDGHVVWYDLSGGPANKDDRAWDIVVGSADHPVVTGFSINADESANFITIKYDRDSGAHLWERSLPGAINNQAPAGWLAVADNDDIFMCNRTWGGSSSYDIVLHRYAAGNGATLWDEVYNGGAGSLDDPHAMIRDAAGDLIVAGVQNSDFMTAKFAGINGKRAWTSNYDGPPGWYDSASCAAIGPGGVIVVSGFSDGTGTGWDVTTIGYDPATGEELWVERFDGADNQPDEAHALVVSDQDDIYVTGYCYSFATNMDLLALRYSTEDLSGVANLPEAPRFVSAYPNPFNPITTISFEIPGVESERVDLSILDLRGRLVRRLVANEVLPPGPHSYTWKGRNDRGEVLAGGVYLLQLATPTGVTTSKAVLVK